MAAPTPTLFEELPVLGKGKYTVGQDKPAEIVLAQSEQKETRGAGRMAKGVAEQRK